MPTGYSDMILQGATFKQFAMKCARAFGACITMKEDSLDVEIPEEFKPNPSFYEKGLEKARDEYARLIQINTFEAEGLARLEYDEAVKKQKEQDDEKLAKLAKYKAMLIEVSNWQPPTPEHQGLKNFMVDQITGSIDFDCDMSHKYSQVTLLTGHDWLTKKIEQARHEINYHTEQVREEFERAALRTNWVKRLRESLNHA
jgi:hypothetical protein